MHFITDEECLELREIESISLKNESSCCCCLLYIYIYIDRNIYKCIYNIWKGSGPVNCKPEEVLLILRGNY